MAGFMNAPGSLQREWSLREIDIVKKTLDDRHRLVLPKMIEKITLTIDFNDEVVDRLNDPNNDTDEDYRLWKDARLAYEDLVAALRKSVEAYNDGLIKRANEDGKHSLHILSREKTILHRKRIQPTPPFEVNNYNDDNASVASRRTVRTLQSSRTLTPFQMWLAGARRR